MVDILVNGSALVERADSGPTILRDPDHASTSEEHDDIVVERGD